MVAEGTGVPVGAVVAAGAIVSVGRAVVVGAPVDAAAAGEDEGIFVLDDVTTA